LCTFVTSGQVALTTASPRAAASFSTAFETPWALKIATARGGTSDSSSTKTAPLALRLSTTNLL